MKQAKIDEYIKRYNIKKYKGFDSIYSNIDAITLVEHIEEFKVKHKCGNFNIYTEDENIRFEIDRPFTKKEIEDIVKNLIEKDRLRDKADEANIKKREKQEKINEKKLYLKLKKKFEGELND
tara:strand:+ start:5609 stop:5974 length:366 start_codon:yes stop_codon:yes gene_type:complete